MNREQLIDKINNCEFDFGNDSYFDNKVINQIADIAEEYAKEQSKWVSAHKELPNKDGKYICCGDYGITIQVWNISCNCWDDEDGDDYYSRAVNGKVDYWKPLPLPPTPQ